MSYRILIGDVLDRLRELPEASVQCVVTSPPYYGLRDYGVDGQMGLEKTPAEYLAKMVAVFREVRRVLRADGTCWVNMGDAYAGSWGAQSRGNAAPGTFLREGEGSPLSARKIAAHPQCEKNTGSLNRAPGLKAKDLMGMPWRLAFALQDDGWWLRQDIIWSKPNPMPESVTDRCTKAHEYLFLLTKSAKYYYDAEAIKEASVTGDERRPYTSQGAWEMDGRPEEQRHGGKLRTSGNKSHKLVTYYEASESEQHRTAAGLMKIADTPFSSRNKRSVWEIATEPYAEAHFATFPTKLVEPCILAGTSERGCCVYCGAASVRRTEAVETGQTHMMAGGWAVGDYAHGSILDEGRRKGEGGKPVTVSQTTGWALTCPCLGPEERDADDYLTACEVLDPFSGSGTTGVVALRYGRNYTGIELNPEYAAMSVRRIVGEAPLLRQQPATDSTTKAVQPMEKVS